MEGLFRLDEHVNLKGDYKLGVLQSFLSEQLKERFDIQLQNIGNAKRSIVLQLNEHLSGSEAYRLHVEPNQITISGSSLHGVFNGIQSLIQLGYNQQREADVIKIPACRIEDAPRFEWRGYMVDVSRQFIGKEKIKELLDLMALHKLNIFHWHLTDESAWRIQIHGYPKLTSVGGQGSYTNPDDPLKYYTQEEIREIVAYASERFIKVIPEIDMPGHASAANRAYPEFSGGGSEDKPAFTFHPSRTSTYQYLTNILREVVALFPSQYIHLGGDEVHFGNQQWKTDPNVQQLMREEGLEDVKEVEHYFMRRMADSVRAMGSRVVGWDEIARSGISKQGTIVMWWHHDKPEILDRVLQQGYTTVLCPRVPMYFNFVQHDSHQWGRRWNGFSDLKGVYEFPSHLRVDTENNPQIKGIQANLWTPSVKNNKRFDFLTWPRLAALAEAAWTLPEQKSYDFFQERLDHLFAILDTYGIYYFNPFNLEATPEPKGVREARWQENHK